MKKIILLLAAVVAVVAQPPQNVNVQPDCLIPFIFTVQGSTAPVNANGSFNNKQVGCNVWQVQYANTGFTVVSLVLQSAPDSSGIPGAFSTISGTVIQGTNPQTSTVGASNLITTFGTAFAPWVRITDTTATGSGQITGVVLGWRQLATAGSSAAGTTTIIGPLGQTTMSNSVSTVLPSNQISGCSKVFVNLVGSGNTLLVAGSGVLNIYICDMEFSTGTAENFKLTEGTVGACTMGTADATATNISILTWSLTPAAGEQAARVTATNGDSLCANQANAQVAGVTLWYLQQ